MNRAIMACTLLTIACFLAAATTARAVDTAALTGAWECADLEEGTLYAIEVGGDGTFDFKAYDFEDMEYRVDQENGQLGMVMSGGADEEEEVEWVAYSVMENVLTINADSDMTLTFDCVWRPEEATHALAGRWVMNLEEFAEFAEEEAPAEFVVQFNNDSWARALELDEHQTGAYTLDAAGEISLSVGDETGTGAYNEETGNLEITVADKPFTFTRVV